MPEIVPPAAPGPVSVLGWDGAQFYVIRTDDEGRQIVRGEDQLWNIQSRYAESKENLNAAAGVNDLAISATPAFHYRVVTNVTAFNRTTAISRILLSSGAASDSRAIDIKLPTAIYDALRWTGTLVLEPMDYLTARFYDCVAGDDIFMYVRGFYMTLG